MRKSKATVDLILLLSLGFTVFLSVAPESVVMTTSAQMLLLGVVITCLILFLLIVWREQPADEREAENQSTASRYAYLVGALSLVGFLIYGSLNHDLDISIPVTLFLMVSTKLIIQNNKNNE